MYLSNKYTIVYNNIINRAKARVLDGYAENHHIIPRSLGGTDIPENLVRLTAREHFICHLLLTKMLTGQNQHKMIHASWCMVMLTDRQQEYKINSHTYKILKEKYSSMRKTQEPWNKGTKGSYTQSVESNMKRSEKLKGRPSPNKGNFGDKNSFFGKTHSDETKEKIKESIKKSKRVPWNKGKKGLQVAWNKGKKITCTPTSQS